MSEHEHTQNPFPYEIVRYDEIEPQLVDLAQLGVTTTFDYFQIVPTYTFAIHLSNGIFFDQFGHQFIELYDPSAHIM